MFTVCKDEGLASIKAEIFLGLYVYMERTEVETHADLDGIV